MKRLALASIAALAVASAAAQAPVKGDLIGDFGIGVGAMDGGEAAFTQRLAVEWGLAEFDMLNSDWTFTLGFQINNGARSKSASWTDWDGVGVKYRVVADDITLMPTGSIHHGFTDNLEGYATLGLGLGIMNSRVTENNLSFGNTAASFAMAFNIGARYWFTPVWAANAQLGLVSAAWGHGHDTYNVFSVGVSYKF